MEWHLRVGWCAKRPHGLAPRVDGISGKMVPRVGWHLGEDGAPSGMASRGRWCPEWDGTSGGLGMLGGMASWYGIFGPVAPQVG